MNGLNHGEVNTWSAGRLEKDCGCRKQRRVERWWGLELEHLAEEFTLRGMGHLVASCSQTDLIGSLVDRAADGTEREMGIENSVYGGEGE